MPVILLVRAFEEIVWAFFAMPLANLEHAPKAQ
jgi:hypothetical protein